MQLEKQVTVAFKPECGEAFSTLTELMFQSTFESETLSEAYKATLTPK